MIYGPLLLILLSIGPAIAAIAILRSPSIRWHLVLLSLCLFYGILPLLIVQGGFYLAERFDCKAESVRFLCSAPSWYGDLITGMVFAHWLAIITIPSAVLGALGLLISGSVKLKQSRTLGHRLKPTAVFYRSRRHKVVAGICVAIAQRWHLPTQGVRIVVVILAIIFPGFILLYPWMWLAFPLSPLIHPTESVSPNV